MTLIACERLAEEAEGEHDAHDTCPGWPSHEVSPTNEQTLVWLRSVPDDLALRWLAGVRQAAYRDHMAFIMNTEVRARDTISIERDVTLISAWIDSSYRDDIDPELHMRRRVDKVCEEAGEVVEALGGMWGENPRKGVTNGQEKVEYELLDVAGAALGALWSITNGCSVTSRLADHLDNVARRMRAAQAEADA